MNKCCAGSELWVMLDPWVLSDIHIKRTEANMLCLCICVYIYIYAGNFQERTLLLSVHLIAAEDGTAAMFTA